jgi:hypothetical protein
MFYAVDLQRLRSIPGSKDLSFLERMKESLDDDDELDALKRIIMGECQNEPNTEHLYGYALKAICEHIGEPIGGEVAAIRDHPYKSKLIANGSPIAIPYSGSNFPEIGYLDHTELAQEYKRATETKPKAKRTLLGFILRKISGGMIGREMSAEDVAEDMKEYAQTLKECMDKKSSLVSFRH